MRPVNGVLRVADHMDRTIAEVVEGIRVERVSARFALAKVRPFAFAVRCGQCGRRHFERSDAFQAGSTYTCPRCSSVNLLPTAGVLLAAGQGCTCHADAANRRIGNHFGDCPLR